MTFINRSNHASRLQEAGVGPVGLEEGAADLLDARRQRELDLGVVHLLHDGAAGLARGHGLNTDDLKGGEDQLRHV